MNNLCERPKEKGNFSYLCSIKAKHPYYYHKFDNVVDNYKEDDGICIIRKGELLHCFYDGDSTVYFLDSKGIICMRSEYFTTHEFYMDYFLSRVQNKLKEPTIKKFIKNIKQWYDYD